MLHVALCGEPAADELRSLIGTSSVAPRLFTLNARRAPAVGSQ